MMNVKVSFQKMRLFIKINSSYYYRRNFKNNNKINKIKDKNKIQLI